MIIENALGAKAETPERRFMLNIFRRAHYICQLLNEELSVDSFLTILSIRFSLNDAKFQNQFKSIGLHNINDRVEM